MFWVRSGTILESFYKGRAFIADNLQITRDEHMEKKEPEFNISQIHDVISLNQDYQHFLIESRSKLRLWWGVCLRKPCLLVRRL